MKVRNINILHIKTVIKTALIIYNTYKDNNAIYSKLERLVYDDNSTSLKHLEKCLSEFYEDDGDGEVSIPLLNNEVVILLCSQMKMLNNTERKIVFKLVQKGIINIAKTSDVESFVKSRFASLTEEESKDPIIQTVINLVK